MPQKPKAIYAKTRSAWRISTLYSNGWLIGNSSSFQYEGCTGVDQA